MLGFTCMPLCNLVHDNLAQWTAGASRHPVFPAPSSFEGEAMKQSSGKTSRETAKACLRSGMRMDARRCQPKTPSLRAEQSNPVCRRGKILDCCAALAMTRMMEVPGAEIAKLLAAFSQRASRAA
jgi:hypothetical protein